MRWVAGGLGLIASAIGAFWFAFLGWNLYWRFNCSEYNEDCYWSGRVLETWLTVGMIYIPIGFAGGFTLWRLWRTRRRATTPTTSHQSPAD